MNRKIALPAAAAALAALAAAGCSTAAAGHPAAPKPPATHSAAAPAPAASTPAPPPAPAMTASQQQAVISAQAYLSSGQGFSRAGLIRQLVFEKFSTADAGYAAGHAGDGGTEPDWNAQAAQSAQAYVSSGQGFSRQGLIDQLTSSAVGFTYGQAVFGVNQAGL